MDEVPDLCGRKLQLREQAPVAGGFGQLAYRPFRKHVVVVAAGVLDLIDKTVITEDPVPILWDVLDRIIRGDIDGAVCIVGHASRFCGRLGFRECAGEGNAGGGCFQFGGGFCGQGGQGQAGGQDGAGNTSNNAGQCSFHSVLSPFLFYLVHW